MTESSSHRRQEPGDAGGKLLTNLTRGAVIVGSAATIVSLFVPWFPSFRQNGDPDFTAFQELSAVDVAILVLAAAAILLTLVDFVSGRLLKFAGASALVLFGVVGSYPLETLFIPYDDVSILWGQWLGTVGSGVAASGAIMGLIHDSRGPSEPWASAPPPMRATAQAVDSPVSQAPAGSGAIAPPAPAGWYPDPLGRSAERYWDGSWTEQTR